MAGGKLTGVHVEQATVHPEASERPASPLFWVFAAVVAFYMLWVLSMPVFPSQDGPLHLYYVNIMRQVLLHKSGIYSSLFYIRDPLPPYALYYYALVALGALVPLEVADKLVVCISIPLLAFGFRFLSRQLGVRREACSFLVLPLLLTWPTMMGFLNFNLSLAMGLWALGLWCRRVQPYPHRGRIVFVLILYVMMLTHALPLLIVLGFCAGEMAIRGVRAMLHHERPGRAWWLDGVYAAAGACAFLYVRLFLNTHPLDQSVSASFWPVLLGNLNTYVRGRGLILFSGTTAADWIYGSGMALLGLCAVFLAGRQVVLKLRAGRWSPAESWAVLSIGYLIALPLIPRDFNGTHYFAMRMASVVFLSLMVSASCAIDGVGRSGSRVFRAAWLPWVSFAMGVLTLGVAVQRISPIAATIAKIEAIPRVEVAPGAPQIGLLLRTNGEDTREDITWDPYWWAGMHYFRRYNLLMYNSPWVRESQIPVKIRPGALSQFEATGDGEVAPIYDRYMETDEQATSTLARVGFLLAERDGASPDQSALAAEAGDASPATPAAGWTCSADTNEFNLCLPPR